MSSRPRLTPTSADEVQAAVASAVAGGQKLEIVGGESKALFGAPSRAGALLDMRRLNRVLDYQPRELTIEVEAGAALSEVESVLEQHQQTFAFDAFDAGAMFGGAVGRATVAGAVVSGVAGPGRFQGGGPRDHLLGFEAVSGRGERFVAGGKVVKNVTGYDLSKLMANSWGRLAALTRLTLRVAPRPEATKTLGCLGLAPEAAVRLMCEASKAPVGLSAAAYLPSGLALLRLEGFERSVAIRADALRDRLRPFGELEPLGDAEAAALWLQTRHCAWLEHSPTLWRIAVAPTRAAALVRRLAAFGSETFIDLGGGRIWACADAQVAPTLVRTAAEQEEAHATLIRAPAELRERTPAFQPTTSALAALSRRVVESFDPCGVFLTGRFHEGADAH